MTDTTLTSRRITPRASHMLEAFTVLCALTASACGRPPEDGPGGNAAEYNGTVTILNKTHEMHTLTILPLGTNLSFDCEQVARDPGALLSPELFTSSDTSAFTVPLFSGEEIAVNPGEWTSNWNFSGGFSDCPAFLVQSSSLPDIVVFYRSGFLSSKWYYHNIELPERLDADEQTIVIEADYSQVAADEKQYGWRDRVCPEVDTSDAWWSTPDVEWGQCTTLTEEEIFEAGQVPQGTRYSWRSMNQQVPLFFQSPVYDEGMPIRTPARCRVPGPGEEIAWEDIPFTDARPLQTIEQGRDGCHTLRFTDGQSWVFCAPFAPFARLLEEPGIEVGITEQFSPRGVTLRVNNHSTIQTLLMFRDTQLDRFYDLRWEAEVRSGCAPIQEECGEVSLPADLRLTSYGDLLVVPGDFVELPVGELHLARVVYKPLINLSCEERDTFNMDLRAPLVEGVLVTSF